MREGLQRPIRELGAFGFDLQGWICAQRSISSAGDVCHLAWLFHPAERAYASVSFAAALDSINLYSVNLHTFAARGPAILTLNGVAYASIGGIPGTILVDPYAPTLEGHWKAHREAVARNRVEPEALEAARAVERAAVQEQAQIDALISSGRLVPAGEEAFQFSWTAAARLAAAIVAATRKVQDLRNRRARALREAKTPPSLPPVEEEVAAYKRHDEMTRAPARRSFFLWVFAATLALFAVSLVTSRETALYGAIVAAVVLFHELGHYAAMRAFGYRDTTIFFIPFLGGAAAGRKIDATLSQEIVVLLAGPLPGLIVAGAAALLGAGQVPQLSVALWALVGINLFNLLPILPLDGGRIVHALLFARNAWLDVMLRTVGVALFALFALTSSSPVLLGFTLLLALGIPHGFHLASLRRSFNQEVVRAPAEPRVHLFFRMLQEKGHGALPFARKMPLARGVLLQSSQNATPRFVSIFFWLIAYLGSLVVGTVAMVTLVIGGPGRSGNPMALHWTPLAPLACPASGNPSSRGAPVATVAQVTSIAVFEEPKAAAEAKLAIEAAVTSARAASIDRVLFLGASYEKPDLAGDDDDDGREADKAAVAAFKRSLDERSARLARMDGMVRERRGTVKQIADKSFSLVALRCTAGGAAEAQAAEEDLSDYFAAGPSLGIRPPWIGEVTSSERHARHTYRIASSAITSANRSLRWHPLWDLWARLRRRLGAGPRRRAFKEEWKQRAMAAIEERRAIEPLDDEVAKLLITSAGFDKPEEAIRVRRELRERLGASDESGQAGPRLMGRTSRAAADVIVEFPWLSTSSAESELPALVGWLCSKSCAEPVLMLGSRPSPGGRTD